MILLKQSQKNVELKQKNKGLTLEIKRFDGADKKFAVTVQCLLEFCSKAHKLFKEIKLAQNTH